jgi:hypothetical protein
LKRLPLTGLLVVSAHLASMTAYAAFVVPQLSTVQAVPLLWWLGVSVPTLALVFALGVRTQSWRDVLFNAGACAVGTPVALFTAAAFRFPGTAKSIALESPVGFWTVSLATWFILGIAGFGTIWGLRCLLLRKAVAA